MTKKELFDAITENGGKASMKMLKADLERIYNDMTTINETPASVDETPAPTPARTVLDTVKVPTITVTGITSVDTPTPAPIAYTPASITPASITPASQVVTPANITPAPTPASVITANARPLTPATTETSHASNDDNNTPTEYYTRLDGQECVTKLDASDIELFAFVRKAITTKYGHNINIDDIPMVNAIDGTNKNIAKVKMSHDRSSGVASASYMHITTFRKVKIAGEKNQYQNIQVIIATLTINNYGTHDTRYYFDPREASPKDVAENNFVLAPNADGMIINAKINKNTGRVVQRVRSIDFILAHTVKREIDVMLEKKLRENNYYGKFYTYFGNERLVD